jgi:uncharacterized membrane protein YeaQ/YmgE (transglycosylase-associated protein family)
MRALALGPVTGQDGPVRSLAAIAVGATGLGLLLAGPSVTPWAFATGGGLVAGLVLLRRAGRPDVVARALAALLATAVVALTPFDGGAYLLPAALTIRRRSARPEPWRTRSPPVRLARGLDPSPFATKPQGLPSRAMSWPRLDARHARRNIRSKEVRPHMGLLSWIILGLIAGVIASFIMGSREGILGAIILGIIGAVVGGFVASALGVGDVTGLNIGSIVIAVIGAIIVIAVWRAIEGRRSLT